jgi:hypothetical protein
MTEHHTRTMMDASMGTTNTIDSNTEDIDMLAVRHFIEFGNITQELAKAVVCFICGEELQ